MENKNIPPNLPTSPKINRHQIAYYKTKITVLVIAVIIIIITIFGIFSMRPAVNAYQGVKSGKANLDWAQELIKQQNFSGAKLALEQSQKDFESSKSDLDKLLWLRPIPYVGRQYKAASHLLAAGILVEKSLISVAETGVAALAPITDVSDEGDFSSLDPEVKREVLKILQRSTPSFQLAASNISLAELELDKVPKNLVIGQIAEAIDIFEEYLPVLKEVFEAGQLVTKFLPEIAGYPQEQNYLLLFQNNDELRPGGGFIGSYGEITVKDAELTSLKTDDTYNLDRDSGINVTYPWQIPTLLSPGLPSWYFRDSNWSPDYPTNAEKADWFYHLEGGQVDFGGVIAITPTFLEQLIGLTGPITLEGQPKQFTEENVTDLLQYYVEQRFVELGLPESYRKNIIGDLANVIVSKIFALPKEKWIDLFKTIEESINEKHFMMYFDNHDIQKFLEDEKWAGKVEAVVDTNDYLMVVDSNMAAKKTDAYMERTWTYDIDLTKEKPTVKLTLNYKNTALGYSWKTTRYRSWTRIYTPKGSKFISVSGNEKDPRYYSTLGTDYEITEELGKTVIGTFLQVEPGEMKNIVIEYELPNTSKKYLESGYNLLAQKQAGTVKPILNINARLPEGINFDGLEGEGVIVRDDNKVILNTDLLVDRYIKFNLFNKKK